MVSAAKKADPGYVQKLERSRQTEADVPLHWDEESGGSSSAGGAVATSRSRLVHFNGARQCLVALAERAVGRGPAGEVDICERGNWRIDHPLDVNRSARHEPARTGDCRPARVCCRGQSGYALTGRDDVVDEQHALAA